MHIDLTIFRKKLVTDLQYNYVGIYTRNSVFSTTSAAHYKDKLFPDGDFLHAAIKDAARCISCTPIKPNIIINMNCDLGFYDEFTKYIIPDE